MKKGLAYGLIGLAVGVTGYASYLIYKRISDARIDSRVVSVDEALAELKNSR